MPFKTCKTPSGKSGTKWGNRGKCYGGASGKAKARKQAAAIRATGWTENAKQPNPLRLDPSRTASIRRRFLAVLKLRFRRIAQAVRTAMREDAFGFARPPAHAPTTFNDRRTPSIPIPRYNFPTAAERVEAFRRWLQRLVAQGLLELDDSNDHDAYWEAFVREAFRQGAGRSFDDVKRAMGLDAKGQSWYQANKKEFLEGAFGQPVAIDKVQLLAGRVFTELDGISTAMATQMNRTLSDGLARGAGMLEIASNLENDVGLAGTRAETIARTEIIRAHAQGQLMALEEMGVEDVGVMVEWSTAADERVCKACEPLEGVVLTLEEAQTLIPRHPNCVVGDTIVYAPDSVAVMAAQYTGIIVELTTANGRWLSVTENHILLTQRGWMFAKDLCDLDYVVDATLVDGVDARPNDNLGHATISEVSRFLLETCHKSRVSKTLAMPEYFHGDGKSVNPEIQIVSTKGILWNEIDSIIGRQRKKRSFLSRYVGSANPLPLDSQGLLAEFLERAVSAADSLVSVSGVSSILRARSLLHHQPVGVEQSSQWNSGVAQYPGNNSASDVELLAYPVNAVSRRVELDHLRNLLSWKLVKIKSVARRHVRNLRVFDVSTESTAYVANGIITSNCRCVFLPANVGEDKEGQTRGKGDLEEAFDKSIEAVAPKDATLEEAKAKTTWTGADTTFSQERPRGILNVFCPTGEGGGIDPTCKSGEASGQTDSPAFKKWFGGSKVVDDEGKPLVVYHGTRHDFDEFKEGTKNAWSDALGIDTYFFSKGKEVASTYANQTKDGKIMQVHLALKNPLVIEAKGGEWTDAIATAVDELPTYRTEEEKRFLDIKKEISDKWGYELEWEPDKVPSSVTARLDKAVKDIDRHILENPKQYRDAKKQPYGYDGIIVKDVLDMTAADPDTDESGSYHPYTDVYIAFRPNQIKSTSNKGTWKSETASISNIFCATGEGSGIDPTCTKDDPGAGGGRGEVARGPTFIKNLTPEQRKEFRRIAKERLDLNKKIKNGTATAEDHTRAKELSKRIDQLRKIAKGKDPDKPDKIEPPKPDPDKPEPEHPTPGKPEFPLRPVVMMERAPEHWERLDKFMYNSFVAFNNNGDFARYEKQWHDEFKERVDHPNLMKAHEDTMKVLKDVSDLYDKRYEVGKKMGEIQQDHWKAVQSGRHEDAEHFKFQLEMAEKTHRDLSEKYSKAVDNQTKAIHAVIAKAIGKDLASQGLSAESPSLIVATNDPVAKTKFDKASEKVTKIMNGWLHPEVHSDDTRKCLVTELPPGEHRAYHIANYSTYGAGYGRMCLDPKDKKEELVRVTAHEYGHNLEQNKDIYEAAMAFKSARVAGEQPIRMKQQFPDHKYDPGEVAQGDKWEEVFGGNYVKDPVTKLWKVEGKASSAYYVGKHYTQFTEVISMGLQELAIRPDRLATKDPEYFRFMVGILSGRVPGRKHTDAAKTAKQNKA